MYRRIIGAALAALAATALLAGCAEDQDPVNRVEAYALPKTLFQGEWFYQRTVVDAPAARSVAWVNMKANLQRIRWDVQEHYIYARMSYEQIQNAKKINQDTGEYLGEVVGAWKIKSHFDIKRAYNPVTGEERNVIEENAADCVWYDCKYMRVDWSKNYATDQNFLYFHWAGLEQEPIPFTEQDASDPRYKPIFDAQSGYIDVTNVVPLKPRELFFARWGISVPLCYFFRDMNCTTEVVKVRNSFWRRDPNRDYEPRYHRGKKDEWFGFFVQERFNYHREQGLSYWAKDHFMTRHNIWVAHHDKDKPCTKDSDCGSGGRCDTYLPFHKFDVAKDTDSDGLPDSYEKTLEALNPESADSDGDGMIDAKDDADGNGVRDLEDFWAWDGANMEFRCVLPMDKREPVPVTYFAMNYPKSLACDEYAENPSRDDSKDPCQPWKFVAGAARDKLSALHNTQLQYDDSFFRVFLRGAYGWDDAKYQKWIKGHKLSDFSGKDAETLKKFGDEQHGFYAFAICPNNPVQDKDPWPCRFPRHSFAQAKELMDQGLTFNHLTYKQAKDALANNEKLPEGKPSFRLGDVRYHQVNYIDQYSPFQFLGVAQLITDPRTGEVIAGTANLSSVVDTVSTRTQEKIDLLNGRIKPKDFINGVDLTAWVNKTNDRTTAQTSSATNVVSMADIQRMYGAMEQDWLKGVPKAGSVEQLMQAKHPGTGAELNNTQRKQLMLKHADKLGILDPARSEVDLSVLKGTPLEKQLINREMLAVAGFDPGLEGGQIKNLTPDMLQKTSIARPDLWFRIEARKEMLEHLTFDRLMTLAELTDPGLDALAKRMKNESPDKLWAKLRNIIATHTVVHELGHAIGLRHNFGGSEDALNFPEKYWKVRTDNFKKTKLCNATNVSSNQLCPLFLQPANAYQLGTDPSNKDGSMFELGNTSIMEYHRYKVSGRSLGRYDHAALLFGYADKVEVFKKWGKVPAGLTPDGTQVTGSSNMFDEWWESNGSVLILFNTRAQSFHYTNWYSQMGPLMYQESNRELVDYRKVNEERSTTGRSSGYYYRDPKDKKLYPRVPYIYCKRTSSDLGDNCLSFDEGADQYEKMRSFITNWDTWYVLSAFPRQRMRKTSPWRYINNRYRYFYSRLKDFNNGFALYQFLFHQWYDQAKIDSFFSDPLNGYGAYTVAINDAFNVAVRTMTMPDLRHFSAKRKGYDGQEYYPEAEFSTAQTTELTNARFFSTEYYDTNYEQTCGYYWRECLHHMGFYLDKILALIALSDPRTYFVGQDTSEDIRQYRISFFNNYASQIVDIFGGILSHEYDRIAPWYDPTKPGDKTVTDTNGVTWVNRVAWRNFGDSKKDPPKPTAGAPLEAGTRFTLQLYAAVMGMFQFQNNFNPEFLERGRLWKKGKGTSWEIKPTSKVNGVIEYVDPWNGSTYVGLDYKDSRGIAQRMLKRANMLKARTKHCTPPNGGSTPPPLDQCVTVSSQDQIKAEQELRDYRDLIDIMVQVTSMYDQYGHNWKWNPYNP